MSKKSRSISIVSTISDRIPDILQSDIRSFLKSNDSFSSLSPEQLDVMVMYEMMGVRMDNKTFQVSQSVSQQQVSQSVSQQQVSIEIF